MCGQHTSSSPWKKTGKGTLVHSPVGAPRVLFSGGWEACVGGHTCGWAEDPHLQKEYEGLFVAFAGGDAHAPAGNQHGDFLQENKPAFGEAVSFCSPRAGRLPIAKGSLAFWLPFPGSRPISVILGASDSHMGAVRGLSPPPAVSSSPFYASPEELFDVGIG